MSKPKYDVIQWLSEVEEHDYPAAESYLSLIYSNDQVADMIHRLKNARIV